MTKKPTTKNPATKKPIKIKSTLEESTTKKPTLEKPITKKPTTKKPAPKNPTARPTAKEPTTKNKKPTTTKKPITNAQITKNLITIKHVTKTPVTKNPMTRSHAKTMRRPETTKVFKPTSRQRTTHFLKPLIPYILKRIIDREIKILAQKNGLPFRSIKGIFAALKEYNKSPKLKREVKFKVCPRLYSTNVKRAAKRLRKLLNKAILPRKKSSKEQVCFGNGVGGQRISCDQCCVSQRMGLYALPNYCLFCVCGLTSKANVTNVSTKSVVNVTTIGVQTKKTVSSTNMRSEESLHIRARRSSEMRSMFDTVYLL